MLYSSEIISTLLFESTNVSVYRIPPGPLLLSKWNLKELNVIWTGSLRLVEQEMIRDNVDLFALFPESQAKEGNENKANLKMPNKPYECLRAKLELYNTVYVPPGVGSLITTKKDVVWAEVWYNPIPELVLAESSIEEYFKIANDGEETIQMTTESAKFYKIIAQIPGSGYHPLCELENISSTKDDKELLVQVALGLKFEETFDTITFSESLNIYKRRFRNFEDQYHYELKVLELEQLLSNITLTDSENKSVDDDTFFQLDTVKGGYHIPVDGTTSSQYLDYHYGLVRGDQKASEQTHSISGSTISTSSVEVDDDDDDDDFGDFVTS